MKCACLYSETIPLCGADTQAMRIPPAQELEALCLSEEHRRCDLYRTYLETLATKPARWSRSARDGEAAGAGPEKQPAGNARMKLIKRLLMDDSAQDLAEYGIALAVIAVGVGAIALALSSDITNLWTNAQTAIHNAAGAA